MCFRVSVCGAQRSRVRRLTLAGGRRTDALRLSRRRLLLLERGHQTRLACDDQSGRGVSLRNPYRPLKARRVDAHRSVLAQLCAAPATQLGNLDRLRILERLDLSERDVDVLDLGLVHALEEVCLELPESGLVDRHPADRVEAPEEEMVLVGLCPAAEGRERLAEDLIAAGAIDGIFTSRIPEVSSGTDA
jgi:hypothetical protein